MLRCADGSYDVGSTRASLEERLAHHDAGTFGGYTARRRPVILVFAQEFQRITDAIARARSARRWRRQRLASAKRESRTPDGYAPTLPRPHRLATISQGSGRSLGSFLVWGTGSC
jgi:predicted GIY-YIG superfamily endonuclease